MELELNKDELKFRDILNRKFYYTTDEAHRIDHIDDVWRSAVMLINRYPERFNSIEREVLFLGIYCHDIFSNPEDRKIHNQKASEFVLGLSEGNLPKGFKLFKNLSRKQIFTVSDMVYWHRSSLTYDGENIYIKIIRAADKGAPIFDKWLERSMKYHKGEPDAVKNVADHFKEKFSEDGYAWKKDSEYKELYLEEYKQFQKDLKEWLKEVGH